MFDFFMEKVLPVILVALVTGIGFVAGAVTAARP
jgi:hypothetical protein